MINISGFYDGTVIKSTRTSGAVDSVPVKLRSNYSDSMVTIVGEIRSYNTKDRHTKIYIDPTQVLPYFDEINEVEVSGYLCRSPRHRFTPGGKEITELLLAVPNRDQETAYIPCIAWGSNIPLLEIGTYVTLLGRLQSREYQKNNEIFTTIELSVSSIKNNT